MSHTNMDEKRYKSIIHNIKIKQLVYTDSIMPKKSEVKCGACGENGHNRKNKSCPLHPSHPIIEFEDSDDDTEY